MRVCPDSSEPQQESHSRLEVSGRVHKRAALAAFAGLQSKTLLSGGRRDVSHDCFLVHSSPCQRLRWRPNASSRRTTISCNADGQQASAGWKQKPDRSSRPLLLWNSDEGGRVGPQGHSRRSALCLEQRRQARAVVAARAGLSETLEPTSWPNPTRLGRRILLALGGWEEGKEAIACCTLVLI
jgi:hypothetical protein